MPPTRYAYYPGCTLKTTAREYDVSTRMVCQALGIELHELPDWTCCGASSAHTTNHVLGIALPTRELLAAKEMDLPVVAACAMCFSRLKYAASELGNKATRDLISKIMDKPLPETFEVWHLLQVVDSLRQNISVKKPLQGLKVACYYGCVLVRPSKITNFDDVENPQIMDRIIRTLGAENIDWSFKTECCGAGLSLPRFDIVLKLSHRILAQAKQAGADCLAVACPLCHSNLDSYQKAIESTYRDEVNLPVLYFTQLIGLALGLSPEQLLLDKHFTDPLPLLRSKGLVEEKKVG